jgi:hypothetical protein
VDDAQEEEEEEGEAEGETGGGLIGQVDPLPYPVERILDYRSECMHFPLSTFRIIDFLPFSLNARVFRAYSHNACISDGLTRRIPIR